MGKHVSPLLGYNNNVRHKNRVFHIQTEDSGVKHPHIITHLFMDGGRILKSVKRSYAEHVGADAMQDVVKLMMKEQHKAMFIALRDGQFDHVIDAQTGSTQAAAAAKAKVAAGGSDPQVAAAGEATASGVASGVASGAASGAGAGGGVAMSAEASVASKAPAIAVVAPGNAPAAGPAARAPDVRVRLPSDDDEMVPMTTRTPELTLDMGALERAAASGTQPMRSQSDLPPPPANLFREKTASGGYRSVPPPPPLPGAQAAASAKKAPSAPPAKKGSIAPKAPPVAAHAQPAVAQQAAQAAPAPPAPPKPSSPSADNRYAAARPAAIFGQSRPQQGSSIFGEDLISDKSLDEVILSYLAEDLEPALDKADKSEKKK
jgi:hypothetical protein